MFHENSYNDKRYKNKLKGGGWNEKYSFRSSKD